MIGETKVDLENRFFSQKWRILEDSPIEVRPLYNVSSSLPKGNLTCWIDIIPETEKA